MTGYYDEMTIYDRKDFYKVKDPEQKKLIQQLENDPEIEKVGPGRYRCKTGKLKSFSSINENRRWRMEVIEKYNGRNVTYERQEPPQRAKYTPIDQRSRKTYFKDVAWAYWSPVSGYLLMFTVLIAMSLVIAEDMLNPSRSDPFSRNNGPVEMAFGLLAILAIFPWMYFFFAFIAIPINVWNSYQRKDPIRIPLEDE